MRKELDPQPSQITLEAVARKAQEVMLEDGHHVPTLIVSGYGQVAVLQVRDLADTSEARFQQLERIGFTLAQQSNRVIPEQVFIITEGWMSTLAKHETPLVRPSEDPNRKEVLLVSDLNVDGYKSSAMVFEMIRGKGQKVTGLRPMEMEDSDGTASPLLEAFVQGFAMGLLKKPQD